MRIVKNTFSIISFVTVIQLSLLMGCGQTFNSNTEDRNLVASSFCSDQTDTVFCAANEILQTKCANCHTDDIHAIWLGYSTSEDWINSGAGRVVAGNADNSTIITKLKNYGGNMPDQAPELSDTEAEALRTWINSLN